MATRAATFTAKIKCLNEFQTRLLHRNALPLPTGADLANTFKYFSTTLLGLLRDVPGQPLVLMKSRNCDAERLALFPTLDYAGLYSILLQLLDTFSALAIGMYDFGNGFLSVISALIPFLDREFIDTLPYVIASTLTIFPDSLTNDIVDVLCWNLLPFTIGAKSGNRDYRNDSDNNNDDDDDDDSNKGNNENAFFDDENMDGSNSMENYASNSAPAILLMVFQFAKDNTAIHRKITECLMFLKMDVAKDLLCVIASGPPTARKQAAHLLFYYSPELIPSIFEKKNILKKFYDTDTWSPPHCNALNCPGKGHSDAFKMCFDHSLSLSQHPDQAPPSFFCLTCADAIEHNAKYSLEAQLESHLTHFEDINHPIQQMDCSCGCGNQETFVLCCSTECTSSNGHVPIRLCRGCHEARHPEGTNHVIHFSFGDDPYDLDPEAQVYLVKAIISLLMEAKPFGSEKNKDECHKRTLAILDTENINEVETELIINERRLLSRYGVWLLVKLLTPNDETPIEILGHLLAMLFQWFHATAYLPNDKTGNALEKLKSEFLPPWLHKVFKSHSSVFISCLMPNPPDYAKVGGHWDYLSSSTTHIKEGLVRLFCLVPYEVITLEVWNSVMPLWMEAIHTNVPRSELDELKNVFCKIFDPDMSPLGFESHQMYQFISEKFIETSPHVQKRSLQWLQILCLLEIQIPFEIIFQMFHHGAKSIENEQQIEDKLREKNLRNEKKHESLKGNDLYDIKNGLSPTIEQPEIKQDIGFDNKQEEDLGSSTSSLCSKEEIKVICFNLMLDVLNSQISLQDLELNVGLCGTHAIDILSLLNQLMSASWLNDVSNILGKEKNEGNIYGDNNLLQELMTDFLQLAHRIILNVITKDASIESDEDINSDTTVQRGSTVGVNNVVDSIKNTSGGLTATAMIVPTVNSSGTTVAIKNRGQGIGTFMAALSSIQTAVEKATKQEKDCVTSNQEDDSNNSFVFKITDYPVPLQLVYNLLVKNTKFCDADMRFYLIDSVRVLAFNCNVLVEAAQKHRKLISWCQHSLLAGFLWTIMESAHSQVSLAAVPLLLHAITLPEGTDIFWQNVEDDFNSSDWLIRSSAVNKVTTIFRFLEAKRARKFPALRSALSHAFCLLISSMDDIQPQISQSATLCLGTIHDSAISTLMWCLEFQFDSVPIDRPIILKHLYKLFNCLIDRKILSWNFFENRFNIVIGEVHCTDVTTDNSWSQTPNPCRKVYSTTPMFHTEEITPLGGGGTRKHKRGFVANGVNTNTNVVSEIIDLNIRSLSRNNKYPYKRTASAPGGIGLIDTGNIIPNSDLEIKNGQYFRQQSAPVMLRRKLSNKKINHEVDNKNRKHSAYEEFEYVNFAARTVNLDEIDKQTLNLLVFLFMQFLSQVDQVKIDECKNNKSTVKCFQSLYSLLGYNEQEKRFTTMPQKIRSTPTVNAFLANLSQILDCNFKVGEYMLLHCILILQKIPFPPGYVTAWQQSYTLIQDNSASIQGCRYSLWFLEPTLRKNWLSSVLVIVYKYNYQPNTNISYLVVGLIRIIIHTIAAHVHLCDRSTKPIVTFGTRTSQLSYGADEDVTSDKNEPGEYEMPKEMNKTKENDEKESVKEETSKTKVIENNKNADIDHKLGEGVTLNSNIMFDFLPRPHPSIVVPTPDHFNMTSENLPRNWAMQLMRSGRTLFINSLNQTTTWIDPRTGCIAPLKNIKDIDEDTSSVSCKSLYRRPFNCSITSPPSPQSLMDIITVGSPVEIDGKYSFSSSSSTLTSPASVIELPAEERLMPIGGPLCMPPKKVSTSKSEISSIFDKVWKAFGSDVEPTSSLINDNIEVVTKHGDENQTEHYAGLCVTHIKNEAINLDDIKKEITKTATPPENKPIVNKVLLRQPCLEAENNNELGWDENKGNVSSSKTTTNKDVSTSDVYSHPQQTLMTEQNCQKTISTRIGEEVVVERCSTCGLIREEYSDEEIGNCIVILSTFINREPALAAPLLPDILLYVTRVVRETVHSWEADVSIYVPGNSRSVARQFIRTVLHQLATNGVFSMLFQMDMQANARLRFFETIVHCLTDFTELNPSVPVGTFLQEMNEKKTWVINQVLLCLQNLACYLKCVPVEQISVWTNVFTTADVFFRRLWAHLSGTGNKKTGSWTNLTFTNSLSKYDHPPSVPLDTSVVINVAQIESLYSIMNCLLRMPGFQNNRSLLEPLAKIVSYTLQNCIPLSLYNVAHLCHLCNKIFSKDRERLYLTRTMVFDFVQALKAKLPIPDANLLLLVNLVLQDCGGHIGFFLPDDYADHAVIASLCADNHVNHQSNMETTGFSDVTLLNTGAAEIMRQQLSDVLEFISDVHTLSKIKHQAKLCVNIASGKGCLNQEILGAILKASLAQYLALEMSRGTARDSRCVNRYMPWLYNLPSNTVNQGAKDFMECVSHMRLISWLLLGSMNHTLNAASGRDGVDRSIVCQPIPFEASCHIADHIQVN